MVIKIEELHNRLTLLLMNSDSYTPLYDLLDSDEEDLLSDIKTYVELNEGPISKDELENQIDDGLMSLMDYYEDNWTVSVYDDEGNEQNLTLEEAMSKKNISRFRSDWKLIDLKEDWDLSELELIDEEDEYSLGDYHSDY